MQYSITCKNNPSKIDNFDFARIVFGLFLWEGWWRLKNYLNLVALFLLFASFCGGF
jgi:hypothetical protein